MKTIPFFTTDITIDVHTAMDAQHVGKSVTLVEFAQYKRMSLYELENGELLARMQNGDFIEGVWL